MLISLDILSTWYVRLFQCAGSLGLLLQNDLTIANDSSIAWVRFLPRRHVFANMGSSI